jgi:hypothetical protein
MMSRRGSGARRSKRTSADDYFSAFRRVPGYFREVDFLLFEKLNELQRKRQVTGDVLEIGAFRGRSAILLGSLIGDNERLVVCDLFSDRKSPRSSASPRELFERNYLRFHHDLPVILQCSSLELPARCEPQSFRLIHIDGGHSFDTVRADIANSKNLLAVRGIVALDDYLNRKFPGVAAAVWEAVAGGELIPICLSNAKMYATWSVDQPDLIPELEDWVRGRNLRAETFNIFDRDVLKVSTAETAIDLNRGRRAVRALADRLVRAG